MTKSHREPPFPDDVKLKEPGPGVGPVRKLVRALCRRLLDFWLTPLSKSMEDRLFEAAVSRRELFEEVDERLRKLEEAGLNTRVSRLERSTESRALGTTSPSSSPPPKEDSEWKASTFNLGIRFRGDEESLKERAKWYLEELGELTPVADLGCGRGLFLTEAKSQGKAVEGCELDPEACEHCQAHELPVTLQDCCAFLRAKEENSLGAIVASHLLEHLSLSQMDDLLNLAHSRLKAGGKLLVELPHPGSLVGLVSFSKDPSHHRPIHPETMAFLLEQKGFEQVKTHFLDPVDKASRLVSVEQAKERTDSDRWARVARNFALLDELVFGYHSFCVIARAHKEKSSS